SETSNKGLQRQYKVIVPANDISKRMDARLKEISGNVNIPGFRAGHAPLAMIKQRYGSSVLGEVIEGAVRDTMEKALEEKGIRPAMQPKVEIGAFGEDKDLEYSLTVDLIPEIKPMDFSKLKLERLRASLNTEEVEKTLEEMAKRSRKTEAVKALRKAKKGDVAVLDFTGKMDGEEIKGGSAKDMALELGSGQFIPGFEDQVIGMEAGETRDITVSFPAEYAEKTLAGKPAIFTITLKELREYVDSKIDEEFAKSLNFTSVDDLRAAVRQELEKDFSRLSRQRLKQDVLEAMAEEHDFDVPPGLLEAELESMRQQLKQAKERGLEPEEHKGKKEAEIDEELKELALRRVRLGLLLAEIGRINKIDVSEDELRRAVMGEIQRYPGREQEVLQFYQSTPRALMSLRAPLLEDKVIDYIIEMAAVTDRSVSRDELFAKPDEEKSEGKAKKPKSKAKK
ncbi:MAG: trigger factor, partial [Dongiaceae bacterium]